MLSSVVQNQIKPEFAVERKCRNFPNKQFSSEINLILACSRTDFGFEEISRVNDSLHDEFCWEFVLTTAYRNGVLPLVGWNLLKHFKGDLPSEVRDQISEFFQRNAAKNLLLTGRLIKIVELLNAADIPVLPFKGATLAQQAYGNPALRQFIDLDILVQPKDFDRAINVLSANDFQMPDEKKRSERAAFFFNRRKDIALTSGNGLVRVELHWKLSGAHFALPFELDELWTRLEQITLGGARLNALPFDDLFIYLCLHGARHGFERLSWICDLRELINRREADHQVIDWAEIIHRARLHGCEKVVELGVFLIEEFFGDKIDFPNAAQIKKDETLKKIAADLRKKIFSEKKQTIEIGDWYLYHLLLKERKTDRLKLHLHYFFWYSRLAFTPNSIDKAVFRLPAAFYPLYYILRPSRLLLNYLTTDAGKK
jgi:hypothetical protein